MKNNISHFILVAVIICLVKSQVIYANNDLAPVSYSKKSLILSNPVFQAESKPSYQRVTIMDQGDHNEEPPADTFMLKAWPNPFNPSTRIAWSVQYDNTRIRLVVYDVLGREVVVLADGIYDSGSHFAEFDATGLASGLYLFVITGGGKSFTGKAMLVK